MRIIRGILSFLLLMTCAAWAQQPVDVAIVIGGKTLDPEPPPRLVGGRVLIPLRKVFNALGADVGYKNKIITAQRGSKVIVLSPNVKEAQIDGQDVQLDVPPLLFEGSTYVPLRFVAQALGDSVAYDGKTKTVTVGPSGAPAAEANPITVPPDRIGILKGRLKQLVVGNQGAILKVRNADGSKEVYYRGLDDRMTAPYDGDDHTGILDAVGLRAGLDRWTGDAVEAYTLLPKRQAIAFLGLVNSIPDGSVHDPGPAVDQKVEEFLIAVVAEDPSVVMRRQAVLSMAVGADVDPQELEAVLKLYESSENLWETFPVQQYFEYHAEDIRALPNYNTVRARVKGVNSLYTESILNFLDGKK